MRRLIAALLRRVANHLDPTPAPAPLVHITYNGTEVTTAAVTTALGRLKYDGRGLI